MGRGKEDPLNRYNIYYIAYVSIRQHTSAYVSIRHTSAYVSIRHSIRQDTSGYVRIRQDTSGYVRIRQDTSGYVCIRYIIELDGVAGKRTYVYILCMYFLIYIYYIYIPRKKESTSSLM